MHLFLYMFNDLAVCRPHAELLSGGKVEKVSRRRTKIHEIRASYEKGRIFTTIAPMDWSRARGCHLFSSAATLRST